MIQLSRKEEKRALIIEAAAKVFARRGFASTLMAEIAIEAGIGKGTLYEYFDSKEDLFFPYTLSLSSNLLSFLEK